MKVLGKNVPNIFIGNMTYVFVVVFCCFNAEVANTEKTLPAFTKIFFYASQNTHCDFEEKRSVSLKQFLMIILQMRPMHKNNEVFFVATLNHSLKGV